MEKDSRLLRIGILGCGPIAQFAHFDACRKARNAELYAICDVAEDLLARLDGIDFRQTAPVRPGRPFLRPYGAEWWASEETLTRPIPGIHPTMIVRAGGLDQGNICMNLADTERRGLTGSVLFLAGSAINSIKNADGKPDPKLGAEAMMQALEVHRSGELRDVPMEEQVTALIEIAERKHLKTLREALRQRYP